MVLADKLPEAAVVEEVHRRRSLTNLINICKPRIPTTPTSVFRISSAVALLGRRATIASISTTISTAVLLRWWRLSITALWGIRLLTIWAIGWRRACRWSKVRWWWRSRTCRVRPRRLWGVRSCVHVKPARLDLISIINMNGRRQECIPCVVAVAWRDQV